PPPRRTSRHARAPRRTAADRPAATRLERVVRELTAHKEFDRIKSILDQLVNEYAYHVNQPHARNGGLIGLAAAAIALGPVSRRRRRRRRSRRHVSWRFAYPSP